MQAAFFKAKHLFLFAVFALLVYNAAGGFAGRLAGGLALAAAAVGGALLQSRAVERLHMLHFDFPPQTKVVGIITQEQPDFNAFCVFSEPAFLFCCPAGRQLPHRTGRRTAVRSRLPAIPSS